jgi:hypothetical protein
VIISVWYDRDMKILLTFFFSAFITLAVVHIVAMEYALYWKYGGFDIFMHILGGVVVALGQSILPFIRIRIFESPLRLRTSLLFVFCIGVLWELFEIGAGISIHEPGFVADTVIDLIMDLAGGFVGYTIVQNVKKL